MLGVTFQNSHIKCLSCLFLLHYYEGRDENGTIDYKVYCMIKDCVKERSESNLIGT